MNKMQWYNLWSSYRCQCRQTNPWTALAWVRSFNPGGARLLEWLVATPLRSGAHEWRVSPRGYIVGATRAKAMRYLNSLRRNGVTDAYCKPLLIA